MAVKQPTERGWWHFWLKKRIPAQQQHTLTQRSIFIFPSRFGLIYLFVCLFLYILGTNYQNNLILMLGFILIGFFVTSILFSYTNLSGLTVKSGQPNPVYANDTASIEVFLSNCLNRNALIFNFKNQPSVTLDLAADHDKVQIPYKTCQRGELNLGRVTIRSYFPLGLLRCWTHLDLDIHLLIYPLPIEAHVALLPIEDQPANRKDNTELNDFVGIKEHQPGEPMSRISWKHVARNQQKLVSKQFNDNELDPMWLSLSQVRGKDIEDKLSKLTFAVDLYSQQKVSFGLQLNHTVIPPASGEQHRRRCLEAMALWQ